MTTTIEAIFDGEVLRPLGPLPLLPNTRVTVSVETTAPNDTPASFLETGMAMSLEGPSDWSENLDKYLHDERLSTHE